MQSIKLFVNDFSPDADSFDDSTGSSFTEASGGGYSPLDLDISKWVLSTNTTGQAVANYPDFSFPFTGPLDGGATIYGWYMVKRLIIGSYDGLLATERFDVPITPSGIVKFANFSIELKLWE